MDSILDMDIIVQYLSGNYYFIILVIRARYFCISNCQLPKSQQNVTNYRFSFFRWVILKALARRPSSRMMHSSLAHQLKICI